MEKNKSVIFLILMFVFLNSIFAGVLIQGTCDSANNEKIISQPQVRMINSFPTNSASTILPSQLKINTSSLSDTPQKLEITQVESNYTSNTFLVTIQNNDLSQTTITDVLVNGYSAIMDKKIIIPPNAIAELLVNLNAELVILRTYEIKVETLEGNSATFFKVSL